MSGMRSQSIRWTRGMIIGHVAALLFGLAGLLIAVPNPHLWADSEMGVRVYQFGMQYAGGLHILFATAAMLLVGFRVLGIRRTVWFFLFACVISLGAELIGTTTGFPFGDYRYTSGLGYQIFSEVPFTIPLSWFYMGLASYVLAIVLVGIGPGWRRPLTAVLAGAVLLTIWDLVLDPAMAHQNLEVRFWIWEQGGLYFGMPAQNFLGWLMVGTLFIGLSRLVWAGDPPVTRGLVRVSYAIYLANLIFAMVISGAVGLWWPVLITILIGAIPATMALVAAESFKNDRTGGTALRDEDTAQRVARGVMSTGASLFLSRDACSVSLNGSDNIPSAGPAILVCHHYHHLLDGCVLYAHVPRPLHILVTLDWTKPGWQRTVMSAACRMARWPAVVRPKAPGIETFSETERVQLLRTGFRDALTLLAEGRVLVVFPEGYPRIDPHGTGIDEREAQPFAPGFIAIARAAERRTGSEVPLVPVGFAYAREPGGRWEINLQVGEAVYRSAFSDEESLLDDLAKRVSALSQSEALSVPTPSQQLSEST